MNKIKKVGLITFLGLSLLGNYELGRSLPVPKITSYYGINALNIERLIALKTIEKDTTDRTLLNSMYQNILSKIDSVNQPYYNKADSLIDKYKSIRISSKRYLQKGIMDKFIEINNKIFQNKETIKEYEIISIEGVPQLRQGETYKKEKNLESLVKSFSRLKKLVEISENSDDSKKKIMALTLLNASKYIPLADTLSQISGVNMDLLLTILSSESLGYPYMIGPTGDLLSFQINPSIIPSLYSKMRLSKESFFRKYIKNMSFLKFKEKVEKDPRANYIAGGFLLKILEEESKNDFQRIIMYHTGKKDYLRKIPSQLRNRIESGKIKNYKNISESDEKFVGMSYLKSSLEKVEKTNSLIKSLK